jgi:Cu/Ag efflux protein CusF
MYTVIATSPSYAQRVATVLMIVLCLSWAIVSSPWAEEQFAGEVLKVDLTAKKLTVKKPDGNRFSFTVDSKTTFAGSRRGLEDLTKGDKVTVEFQMAAGQYKALKIVTP